MVIFKVYVKLPDSNYQRITMTMIVTWRIIMSSRSATSKMPNFMMNLKESAANTEPMDTEIIQITGSNHYTCSFHCYHDQAGDCNMISRWIYPHSMFNSKFICSLFFCGKKRACKNHGKLHQKYHPPHLNRSLMQSLMSLAFLAKPTVGFGKPIKSSS